MPVWAKATLASNRKLNRKVSVFIAFLLKKFKNMVGFASRSRVLIMKEEG
jgi:hypothetical protein